MGAHVRTGHQSFWTKIIFLNEIIEIIENEIYDGSFATFS